MNHLGFGQILRSNVLTPEIGVKQRILDIIHQKEFAEISQKINKLKLYDVIIANKKTFAGTVGGNVTDSLTAACRNSKNQEIVH